jgi:hypothetical protein
MVGEQIGKYRITRQVGRGGMGTVYAAIDDLLQREVAIKVLNAGLEDPTVARRFHAEAIAVARLNHPGIATIYELFEHDGQQLMVMEFVRGNTLESVLSMGPLEVDRAASIVLGLLGALAHAHSLGVVHRDLKPANLILTADGGVKITDFGIARVVGAEQLTAAGFMMGTPSYMAPEQVLGQPVDGRTDLYTVGLVFFQMLTGELPFKRGTAMQVAQARVKDEPVSLEVLRPDLPEWCGVVIDRALRRNPDHRFQDAASFADAIERGRALLPLSLEPHPALDTAALAVPVEPTAAGGGAVVAPAVAGPAVVYGLDGGHVAQPAAWSRPWFVGLAAAAVLAVAVGVWLGRGAEPAEAVGGDGPAVVVESGDVDGETVPAESDVTASESTAAGQAAPATSPGIEPDAGGTSAAAAATPLADVSGTESGLEATGPAAQAGEAARDSTPPVAANEPAGSTAATEEAAGTPALPTTVTYRGVRGFIVEGNGIDEPSAELTIAPDEIRLTNERGSTVLTALPASAVTSAAYTRARNPRWYPTLAGPPSNLDLPGGLFRGRYHWLSLQGRDGYIIVRMNDNDWQRITETVTRILGLEIHQLDPP